MVRGHGLLPPAGQNLTGSQRVHTTRPPPSPGRVGDCLRPARNPCFPHSPSRLAAHFLPCLLAPQVGTRFRPIHSQPQFWKVSAELPSAGGDASGQGQASPPPRLTHPLGLPAVCSLRSWAPSPAAPFPAGSSSSLGHGPHWAQLRLLSPRAPGRQVGQMTGGPWAWWFLGAGGAAELRDGSVGTMCRLSGQFWTGEFGPYCPAGVALPGALER